MRINPVCYFAAHLPCYAVEAVIRTARGSKHGGKRNEGNKVSGHHWQQLHSSGFNRDLSTFGTCRPSEIMSANCWAAGSISRKPQATNPDFPEAVDRKVKALPNKLTTEIFDSVMLNPEIAVDAIPADAASQPPSRETSTSICLC